MPNKTSGARCVLQVYRTRRLSVYPDTPDIEQDICDVTLWLAAKHRLVKVIVCVDRHYIQSGRQIAGVTVFTSSDPIVRLNDVAHEAFLALGYTIENTGADIYTYQHCDGRHTRHEAIHAYARIEAALQRWRST